MMTKKKRKRSNPGQYMGLAMSFGLTMAITLFLMFKAGAWLDAKMHTKGLFTIFLLICGIGSSFKLLLRDIDSIERQEKYRQEMEDDDESW